MNDKLLKPIVGGEVKTTLLQMFPTKAPRPDGFPTLFSKLIGKFVARR
jgi:hypothetical protein